MRSLTRVVLVVSLMAWFGARPLPGSTAAQPAAAATVSLDTDRGSASVVADGGGNGKGDSKEKQDFQTFNPSFTDNSTGNAGTAKAVISQDTSLQGTLADLTGLTSQSSGSAHVAGNGVPFPQVNLPDADAESSLSVSFTVAGGSVDFHLTGSIDASARGQAGPRGCVHITVDGTDAFDVSQNPEAIGGPCQPATAAESVPVDDSGTWAPGTHALDISLVAQANSPNTANTDSATATADWDLNLTFGCGAAPRPAPGPRGVTAATGQCVPAQHILFESRPSDFGQEDVFVASANGTSPAHPLNLSFTFNKSETNPAWSPDGQRVAFVRDDQIFTMTAGGSDVQQLTNTQTGTNDDPAWSPNGQKIAFDSSRDGNDEIYVMGANGQNETRLTHNPALDLAPSWSPHGAKIAFESLRTGNFDIFSMLDSPGAAATRLTNDPTADLRPDFTPDAHIVFTAERDGNREIYIMDASGDHETNLTNNSADDDSATVSPDGGFVAFDSTRSGGGIFIIPIGGGDATQLFTPPGTPGSPDWGQSACTFYGTNVADTFTGDGHLCGGPGDDHLTGGSGPDVLDGGPGKDTLSGMGGADEIFGGNEPNGSQGDTIKGGEGDDFILGGDGNDTIAGGGGNDEINGGGGADDISGDVGTTHPGNDSLFGNDGNDTIDGGPGNDRVSGGPGNDTLDPGPGEDVDVPGGFSGGVFGGPGNDTITACDGNADHIDGGPDNDTATFDHGKDTVTNVETKAFC